MTEKPELMPEVMPDIAPEADNGETRIANMLTLEICFLGVMGLLVIAAFFEALSYKIVSSRTPFVIMVPLFLLIVVHARRLFKVRKHADFISRIRLALSGQMPDLNKAVSMTGWLFVLLGLIFALGHYGGILIFGFVTMRLIAREKLGLALLATVLTALAIYGIFEIGFNVELYRGLLWRYFAGYRDF